MRKPRLEKIDITNLEKELREGYEEEKNFNIISRVMTEKFDCPFCYHIPIEALTTLENDPIVATGKGKCRRCHY